MKEKQIGINTVFVVDSISSAILTVVSMHPAFRETIKRSHSNLMI